MGNLTSQEVKGNWNIDMRTFVTGDTHGAPLTRFNRDNFPQGKELTKEDVVIILGDFGFLWSYRPTKEEKYWLNWLNQKPWTTLVVDGNHENHTMFNELPKTQKYGNTVGVIRPSIFHLKRGLVYDINGKSAVAIGGGTSIDKLHRKIGLSWWPEEEISNLEIELCLSSLDECGNDIDMVLAHDCPQFAIPTDYRDKIVFSSPTRNFLTFLAERVYYSHWYHGHWHVDTSDGKHHCFYQSIKEITQETPCKI